MKSVKNGFGLRLKKLRKNAGMTQTELADKLDKSGSAVRMWELGQNEPDISTLVELSAIFDCSLDYLLCRDAILGKEGAVRTNIPVYRLNGFAPKSEPDFYQSILPEYLDNSSVYIMILNDLNELHPLIPKDAIVLIRRQESCLDGQIVLFRLHGKYYLRKISFCDGGIVLFASFPEVPSLFVSADDTNFEILGVAVEFSFHL